MDSGNFDFHAVMNDTVCIILAGGLGRRLYPMTLTRCKPAVPFAGNYRIIDIPISNCMHSHLNQIFVLTQYNSASLNRHITQTYKFDIFSTGFVDVLASEETLDVDLFDGGEFPHGTADAVRRSFKHFLAYRKFKYALVLAGDQLYRMDFRKILAEHFLSGAEMTMGVIPVPEHEAQDFGIMQLSDDFRVTGFVEKPADTECIKDWSHTHPEKATPHFYASMGMYLFNMELLEDVLFSNSEMMDFGSDIIPNMLGHYDIRGFIHPGFWRDVGTIKSFHEANLSLTDYSTEFGLYDHKSLFYSKPRFLPPSLILANKMKNVLLSDGAVIAGNEIEDTVVGVRSIIGKGSRIYRTVILGNDFYEEDTSHPSGVPPLGIGENCVIKNAIIDKNCRIGKNVKIVNSKGVSDCREKLYTIDGGIVVIPKDSVIPDGTII